MVRFLADRIRAVGLSEPEGDAAVAEPTRVMAANEHRQFPRAASDVWVITDAGR
jgi:hypothetical protein